MKLIIQPYWALAIITAFSCAVYATSQDAPTTIIKKEATVVCGDENIQCSAVILGAVGDPIMIDVSKYKITDLGKITQEKEITLQFPKIAGTQLVYSFTPTTGESKDRLIYFVLDNIKTRPGTRLAGLVKVRMGRRFADEDPKKWIEVGNLITKDIGTGEAKITLKPDGTAVWIDPQTNEPRVFRVGKQNLK